MAAEPISATATATTVTLSVASGLGAAIGVSFIDSASMSILGAPAIVPFFGFLGSMVALVYSESIRPWYRLALILWANMMLGIVGGLAMPHIPLFDWSRAVPPQYLAFVIALLSMWLMPVIAKSAAPLFDDLVTRFVSSRAKE